jgi:hypothetical protein
MSDPTGNWPRWITAVVVVAAVIVAVAVPVLAPIAIKVAVVATATLVAQTIHYDVRQSKNTPLPDNKKAADEQKWDNSVSADLHQYSAKGKPKEEKNVKYVSPDGKKEAIYAFNGDMVLDSRDIGTYNFCPSGTLGGNIGHFFVDVLPWALFGNSDDDWGPLINIFTD